METPELLEKFLPKSWLKEPNPNNKSEISRLPTILEIKEKLKEYETTYSVDRENTRILKLESIKKEVLKNNPEYINSLLANLKVPNKKNLLVELQNIIDNTKFQHKDSNLFIATKTQSCTTLKPNITQKHFLYRGQTKFYEECTPNVRRKQVKISHIVENIKREEFNILLDSHPLFKLLNCGIELRDSFTLKLDNPYGLAQHYGFRTHLLDLTSDFDVASFFASAEHNEVTDIYSVYPKDEGFGVLYVYHMRDSFSDLTEKDGLSTIGLQPFSRSGNQKGFLWMPLSNNLTYDFHNSPYVTKIFFKQKLDIAKSIFNSMKGGKYLFKNDLLSIKAKDILSRNVFSEAAFERNRNAHPYNRKDDPSVTKRFLEKDEKITISPTQPTVTFSEEELGEYYKWITNDGWEKFCEQIIFPNDVDNKLKNELLWIKNKDEYRKYFYKQ